MDSADWLKMCARKTNTELFAGLKILDAGEAKMLGRILAHLATLDARDAAVETAYASLFGYCTRKLGYSEAEAYLRIRAAKAALRYPRILTMIGHGEINVTAVARVAPHLTCENTRSVHGKAARRSREEVDRLVAELAPQPEKPPVIRSLSVGTNARPAASPEASLFDAPSCAEHCPTQGGSAAPNADVPVASTSSAEMPDDVGGHSPRAAAGRVLFKFVGSEALRAKFKRARELLAHKYPRGLPEEIFDDALEALLDGKDPWRRMVRREKRRQAVAARNAAQRVYERPISGHPGEVAVELGKEKGRFSCRELAFSSI